MQSLPTEAGPLSHCSQCGKRVASASGTPTFVYGVGAVGYQSCAACGAKWRYLWKESTSVVRRSRRPLAIVGGLLVIGGLAVVAAVAFRGSPTKYEATPTTKPPAAGATTATSSGTGDDATGADFVNIFKTASDDKTVFMQWLASTARATPQFEVNPRVATFVRDCRETEAALTALKWPDSAADEVATLVTAYHAFLEDADLLQSELLYSDAFARRIRADSQAVKDAATAVRSALGLPPIT